MSETGAGSLVAASHAAWEKTIPATTTKTTNNNGDDDSEILSPQDPANHNPFSRHSPHLFFGTPAAAPPPPITPRAPPPPVAAPPPPAAPLTHPFRLCLAFHGAGSPSPPLRRRHAAAAGGAGGPAVRAEGGRISSRGFSRESASYGLVEIEVRRPGALA